MAEMTLIDKVTVLLEVLSASERELSIRDFEERCGIPRSTVHRILRNLEQRGWTTQNPETERYNIGLRFLFLYRTASFHRQFLETALPLMRDLVDVTGQTALISVLEGDEGYCIFTHEPSSLLRYAASVGMRFPIYAGATGKILLAHAPLATQERVLKASKMQLTPHTVTDEATLRTQIDEIRRNGYACSAMELQDHSSGISVPLLNAKGGLIAQFGIAGPTSAFEGKMDAFLQQVRASATAFMELLESGNGK